MSLGLPPNASSQPPHLVFRRWEITRSISLTFWAPITAEKVFNSVPDEPKDEKEYLPSWLRTKRDYSIWQRNNLWMLHNALAAGGDDCVTLIALWDCEPTGDGPGGTSDLVAKVEKRGAKAIIIDTKKEFGL